jgi:tyrosyl-tRNA synthetase
MDAWETLVARGFVQQTTGEEKLQAALRGPRLTVYAGFDPTADSLHVGHLVPVLALAWLQRAGHRVLALVGGGTARVGDPTGRTDLRQMLDDARIAENSAAIRRQLERFLVLDGQQGELVDNADWLMPLNYLAFLREIGALFSVNRMIAAEAYKQRLEKGLSFLEFNYQILQAYDYLELFRREGCALQVGGDDQWGNILAGVDLVRRCHGAEVHALTQPLITTAAGTKMGKSAAGAVWLSADRTPPFDFYQYWLNVDDRDVGRFLRLYTLLPLEEVERLSSLEGAALREAKRVLAQSMTALVHGDEAAERAANAAAAMVSGEGAEELPTFVLPSALRLVEVLRDSGLASSLSEARKLVRNGGVRLGLDKVTDEDGPIEPSRLPSTGVVLRVGKRRAVRLLVG